MQIPFLNPETAFAMTGLSGWSLAVLVGVVGRRFPRQGVAWIMLSMVTFGAGYLLIALSKTLPTQATLLASYVLLGLASAAATLGMRRFLLRRWDRWDTLIALIPVVFPVLWGVVSHDDFARRVQLVNTGCVIQIAVLCTVILRARKGIVGNGWKLMLLGAGIQALTVLPFAFPGSPPSTVDHIAQSTAEQIFTWALCVVMFLNLQLSVLSYLMMLQDRLNDEERVAAELDALTQLPNRRSLERRLAHMLPALHRDGETLGFILLDIDHFKRVNDTLGHDVGDLVLQHVAKVLRQHLRQVELLARYGGEEFVVALTHADTQSASQVAEGLVQAVRDTPLLIDGAVHQVTVSAGVHLQRLSLADGRPLLAEVWGPMLREADLAMYAAKRAGRDRFAVSGNC